jgi:hypothetical protein
MPSYLAKRIPGRYRVCAGREFGRPVVTFRQKRTP